MSATPEIKNVILVGATGNVGSLLIAPLAATFNLTLLSRSSSTSKPSHDNIKTIRADYTLEDLTKAFAGQDALVSAGGAVAFGEQKVMIDAAVAAGVKRFLPSEMSMNGDAKAVRDLVPVFQTKYEILDYLKSKEEQGLTWTGLGTGPLFDWVSCDERSSNVDVADIFLAGTQGGLPRLRSLEAPC
jgi:nucleoside-diphosphate-sugar epimerase